MVNAALVYPDPRYLTFELNLAKTNPDNYMPEVVQKGELEKVSVDKHRDFFSQGSSFENEIKKSGLSDVNAFTLKNPENYTFVDNYESIEYGKFLTFSVRKCNNATSTTPCADFGPGN